MHEMICFKLHGYVRDQNLFVRLKGTSLVVPLERSVMRDLEEATRIIIHGLGIITNRRSKEKNREEDEDEAYLSMAWYKGVSLWATPRASRARQALGNSVNAAPAARSSGYFSSTRLGSPTLFSPTAVASPAIPAPTMATSCCCSFSMGVCVAALDTMTGYKGRNRAPKRRFLAVPLNHLVAAVAVEFGRPLRFLDDQEGCFLLTRR